MDSGARFTYSVKQDYGEINVAIKGSENPVLSTYELTITLPGDSAPIDKSIDHLLRQTDLFSECVRTQEIEMQITPENTAHIGHDHVHSYYKLDMQPDTFINVSSQYMHDAPVTKVTIRSNNEHGNIERAILSAYEGYKIAKTAIQEHGFDLTEANKYISAFGATDLRQNPVRNDLERYIDHNAPLPPKAKAAAERVFADAENAEYAGKEIQFPDSPTISIQIGDKEPEIYNRTGQPSPRKSKYVQLMRDDPDLIDLHKQSETTIERTIDFLIKEAEDYVNRAAAFQIERNYTEANMDYTRASRILDIAIKAATSPKAYPTTKYEALLKLGATDLNRAVAASRAAELAQDTGLATRIAARAEKWLKPFYESIVASLETQHQDITTSVIAANAYTTEIIDNTYFGEIRKLEVEAKKDRDKALLILKKIKFTNSSATRDLNDKTTEFSPQELDLDSRLGYFSDREMFEEAAQVRDRINERKKEDPLELEKRYD